METEGVESIAPIVCEKILLATGRRLAVDELGLEAAGVELNACGQLELDDSMRVKGAHIFAAGDVAGLRMVVHHAHIEAGIAAENAYSDGDRKWTKRSNIEVIFSDPEFAFAGCPPAGAEKDGYQILSACAESRDIGKLHLAGDDSGFGEFWADPKTGRLVRVPGYSAMMQPVLDPVCRPTRSITSIAIDQLEDAVEYLPIPRKSRLSPRSATRCARSSAVILSLAHRSKSGAGALLV